MFKLITKPTLQRHLISLLMASLMFGVILGVLLIKKNTNYKKDMLVVREVSIATPPPPPPPTQKKAQEPVPELTLAVEGEGAPIIVSEVKLEETLETLDLVAPDLQTANNDWDLNLEVNWSAFGLDELDGVPSLLTALKVEFPRSLSNRGIKKVVVKLDVFIDETGRTSLISILENQYPEMKEAIERVIRNSRFSIPKREGTPVQARFIWPVEFTNS